MVLTNRAKTWLTVILVLLMLAMLTAMAEGAVRIRQWIKYGSANTFDKLYRIDSQLNLRVPLAGAESGGIRINSLGFRGPEIDVPKPPERLRIAFLGGSTTYCAEVSSNEMTWPHLTTEALQEAFDEITVDYINGGVPGYVVNSSLRNLRHRIAPLQPDVIVIYHATNDLSGETRNLAAAQGIHRLNLEKERSWLSQYSLLWHLVEKNVRLSTIQREASSQYDQFKHDPADLGEPFRRELTVLVEEAAKMANVVVLATFAHRIRAEQTPQEQREAAISALYYMPFMTPEQLLEAYSRYNNVIREVARDTGAILIEGEMAIPADGKHFNDTVHFKDAGSRWMAGRISRALIDAEPIHALIQSKTGESPRAARTAYQ